MMVYELYFEEHVKEVGLDVIAMIHDELIIINEKYGASNSQLAINNLQMEKAINHFYEWYMQPNNEVKKRIGLIDEKSLEILWVINNQ